MAPKAAASREPVTQQGVVLAGPAAEQAGKKCGAGKDERPEHEHLALDRE